MSLRAHLTNSPNQWKSATTQQRQDKQGCSTYRNKGLGQTNEMPEGKGKMEWEEE